MSPKIALDIFHVSLCWFGTTKSSTLVIEIKILCNCGEHFEVALLGVYFVLLFSTVFVEVVFLVAALC